jgi:hypothetical protein
MNDDNDILQGDNRLQSACEAIREHGDNMRAGSINLDGTTYQSRDAATIWTVKVDGIEIGYRLQVFNTYLNRQVFIKVPGAQIAEIKAAERERIMSAVFNVFVHPGSNLPTIDAIAPDCILLQQQIIPEILIERAPGLVSMVGGFDG